MNCEIIAVGSELTSGFSVDSNSTYIARELLNLGIECLRQTKVPDDVNKIGQAIDEALTRAEVLIVMGGLGPTSDDLTREGLCQALDKKLIFNPKLEHLIQEKFKRLGETFPKLALNQAYLPEGATAIYPSQGTAPGIILEKEEKIVFALPGVFSEMEKMLKENVIPMLKKRVPPSPVILTRVLKTCGLKEALLAQKIGGNLRKYKNLSLSFLPHLGEVHLQLKAKGSNLKQTEELLLKGQRELESLLGEVVFGFDQETLEEVVGSLLRKYELKIAVAESCTAGLLAHRLTNIPGSSDYFWGGVVAYSNKVKRDLVGVPKQILLKDGAVSSAIALALADGVRRLTAVDIGLGITGIAGPTGGTPEKPVGLVFIALCTKRANVCERFQFFGSRVEIKSQIATAALNRLRLFLLQNFESGGRIA